MRRSTVPLTSTSSTSSPNPPTGLAMISSMAVASSSSRISTCVHSSGAMNFTVGGSPTGVALLTSITDVLPRIPARAGADHLATGEAHGLHGLLAGT